MNKNGKPLGVLLEDDNYCLQELIRGLDIKISANCNTIGVQDNLKKDNTAILLPKNVLDDIRAISFRDIELVGTLAGDKFHVYDILRLDHEDISGESIDARYYKLIDLIEDSEAILNGAIEIVPSFFDLEMKEEKLAAIRARDGDGVVFRHIEDGSRYEFESTKAAEKTSRKRQP